MGSAAGARRTAASRVGLSEIEYADQVNAGRLWCTRDQCWHPAEDFATDNSRLLRGRAASCRRSNNAAARRAYVRRDRPAPGRRYVEARDDDREQARRRVNYLVEAELIPHPNTVPCLDCGHVWCEGERRHEHDHHNGYAPEHHEDVQVVCSTCHHKREAARRGAE